MLVVVGDLSSIPPHQLKVIEMVKKKTKPTKKAKKQQSKKTTRKTNKTINTMLGKFSENTLRENSNAYETLFNNKSKALKEMINKLQNKRVFFRTIRELSDDVSRYCFLRDKLHKLEEEEEKLCRKYGKNTKYEYSVWR